MSNNELLDFSQGKIFKPSDANFVNALQGVVDYRGDVTVKLKNGTSFVGYVFSADHKKLDMFPRDSSRKESVDLVSVSEVILSGEDTAKGKSWEDWVKKKAAEKAHPSLESNVTAS